MDDRISGSVAGASAARGAEITGRPQRIAPLASAAIGPDTRALIDRVHDSIGVTTPDEIDDYFATMAKHPEMLRCQLEMGAALFRGAIAPRDRELAVLRIAWLLGAPYEWGEHVRIARRCGVAPQEIEQVIVGAASPEWSSADAAILRGVEDLIARQSITDENWAALAAHWDEPQLIEFVMMVGQYVATAIVQNALRIRLTDGNAGLDAR